MANKSENFRFLWVATSVQQFQLIGPCCVETPSLLASVGMFKIAFWGRREQSKSSRLLGPYCTFRILHCFSSTISNSFSKGKNSVRNLQCWTHSQLLSVIQPCSPFYLFAIHLKLGILFGKASCSNGKSKSWHGRPPVVEISIFVKKSAWR